jgi:hypothetical protein
MFERAIAIRDDRQQALAIVGGGKDTDGLSHFAENRTPAGLRESSVRVRALAGPQGEIHEMR